MFYRIQEAGRIQKLYLMPIWIKQHTYFNLYKVEMCEEGQGW